MIGPGKYDDACTQARLATDAKLIALIVYGGKAGSGFSVQGDPLLATKLPEMLRMMADSIDGDVKRDLNPPLS